MIMVKYTVYNNETKTYTKKYDNNDIILCLSLSSLVSHIM